MRDADRFKLLETYTTPRVRLGRILTCEARDCNVIVTGCAEARIPWPKGRPVDGHAVGPVIFGGLAEAVRREANQAVCYWFGVTPCTVSKWRRLLGIKWTNPGTRRLRSDYFAEPWARRAQKKAQAKARDPERRRKIAAAQRGKKRPRHVVEAMRKGRTGKQHTADARAKMRVAHAAWLAAGRRSFGRAWTPAEDELVRTLPASTAAARTGRTLCSVYIRRVDLKVPDGRATNVRRTGHGPC